ncbi:PAS domain S-box protein [Falsiroseomonas sp. E2-1-a20]|uniref:hybrid sensor histidine kinase/response regulator n=1 Tax=Falsiroseomonas sp. E2-1-a20 TaxID=3239300 RepID=UPI003F35FB12
MQHPTRTAKAPNETGRPAALAPLLRLAARGLGAPHALAWLADGGMLAIEGPDAAAAEDFCAAAFARGGEWLQADATDQPDLAALPMRFRAAVPLRGASGAPIGVLAVLDGPPRPGLDAAQRAVLEDCAAAISAVLPAAPAPRDALLRIVAEAPSFAAAIDAAMTMLRDATGSLLCLFFRLAPDGRRLQLVSGQGSGPFADGAHVAGLRALDLDVHSTGAGQALLEDRQIIVEGFDDAALRRWPGAALGATRGMAAMVLTPVTMASERCCIAFGFGPGRTDLAQVAALLRDAAGALHPLLRRLRDTEELELFRRVVEASGDPVVVADAGTQHPDGPRIIYANAALLRQTGYAAAELLGRNPRLLLAPEADPQACRAIRQALADGRPVRQEIRNRRRDGSLYWAEVNISPVTDAAGWRTHWMAIQRDTTRQREETTALSESEAAFRDLFHNHPAPMWVYDKSTLDFIEVNQAAVAAYGWTRAEFLRMNLLDIRPEAERARVAAAAQGFTEGLLVTGPWTHRTATGAERQVQILSRVITFRGQPASLVVVMDVTERLRAENAARELAADLHATFESFSDGLVAMGADWRFTYVNGHAERLLRRKAAALIGQQIWDVFPEVIGTEVEHAYRTALAKRETRNFTYFFAPLETWFDITAYPARDGLTLYFRDVTERKLAELQMAQQAALLDQASDAILVVDQDHRVQFWNRSAERLYGWSRAEVLGRSALELTSDDPVACGHALRAVLRDGAWTGQVGQRRKDGSRLMVEGTWTLVRDAAGAPRAILAVNTDITARLELEGALRQAQRLEAIGQLTGGVAHDFNNLLTVILGNAELLAEALQAAPGSPDPAQVEMAEMARMTMAAAERGAALTGRLLAFSRRQALDPRAVDLPLLLGELAKMLRPTLGEHVETGLVHAEGLWPAMIDAPQLENAVLNLCLNARDAMPSGGRLMIETSNVTLDETYARHEAEVLAGDYVMIAVSDTGSGMTAEVAARAVEPFFTTKEVGQGSGLGLSMVFGFVKQSGGHLKIYSEPGLGTTVKLYLPRASGSAGHGSRRAEAEPPRGRAERLLVVEDDGMVRAHVATQLRDLGYEVIVAANAAEALEVLRAPARIDLLFTDVVMPGAVHGPALAEAARRLRPGLRVLFTSGYTQNGIMHHGRLDPGVLLLNKPYRRRDLAEKLRLALERVPDEPEG